ncbi:unnamed protein product [Adineta ricciae]|uniref:Uncharacterized protein n=1 Tax=Adineta ricciae TaxID=249248 RepID=A0A815MYL9_ADIRI|nr:unnamed protein product [Adineta ricciae]CAF1670858.1 unnamed protein product [Adineta ricciae]
MKQLEFLCHHCVFVQCGDCFLSTHKEHYFNPTSSDSSQWSVLSWNPVDVNVPIPIISDDRTTWNKIGNRQIQSSDIKGKLRITLESDKEYPTESDHPDDIGFLRPASRIRCTRFDGEFAGNCRNN